MNEIIAGILEEMKAKISMLELVTVEMAKRLPEESLTEIRNSVGKECSRVAQALREGSDSELELAGEGMRWLNLLSKTKA
ncbi:MAG: hypothetical protein ABF893_17550 [Gluconacetobacter liquefaciens]